MFYSCTLDPVKPQPRRLFLSSRSNMATSDHERQVLENQLHYPEVKISFFSLYRYATTWDVAILLVSIICALGSGVSQTMPSVCRIVCVSASSDWYLTRSCSSSSVRFHTSLQRYRTQASSSPEPSLQ